MSVTPRSFLPNTLSVTVGNGPIAGYTQRYNLNLVNFDWVTWHDYEWENWVVIDALLNAALQGTVIEGAWKANTAYAVNDVVVDTRDGSMLIAVTAHTSSENLDTDIAAGKWGDYDISGAPVTVAATPPTTPKPGDLWFATVEPVGLYVWYNDGNSSQWVQTNGGEGTPDLPITGGTLTGPLIVEDHFTAEESVAVYGNSPRAEFRETDQTLPDGYSRIQSIGGGLNYLFNTSVDGSFTTFTQSMRVTKADVQLFVPITSTSSLSGANLVATSNATAPLMTLSAPMPVLVFDETDFASPAGHFRMRASSNFFAFEKAATADFATVDTIWNYSDTDMFQVYRPTTFVDTVTLTSAAPTLVFDESDQVSPAGHYRLRGEAGTFGLFKALTANFATSDTIWQHNGSTTDTLNVFKGVSISGAVGASNAGLKLDSVYPTIWFHDTTPVGSADMLIGGGNGHFLFTTADANGAFGTTFADIGPDAILLGPTARLAFDDVALGKVEIGHTSASMIRMMRTGSINYIQVPAGANLRVTDHSNNPWATISSNAGWAAGSDARLKHSVRDIRYGLDTIMQLRAVEFDWIDSGKHDIGLIAQEVQPIVPEIVEQWLSDPDDGTKGDMLALRKDALVAVLIKAVQELAFRVRELEGK